MQKNINVGQATPDNVSAETSYRCQETAFALFQSINNKKGTMSLSGHCQAKPDLPELQRSGFTLIELLVVVLIIGILAAVALPQYQKAVDKARYTQAMTLLESIWQAQERYKLANGEYTKSLDDLDIDLPTPISSNDNNSRTRVYKWGRCFIESFNGYLVCQLDIPGYAGAWYFAWPGSLGRECWAFPADNKRANELCKAMTKKSTGTLNGSYKMYGF